MHIWTMQHYMQVNIENGLNYREISDSLEDLSRVPICFQYLMVRVHTSTCCLSYLQLGAIIDDAVKTLQEAGALEKVALVVNTRLQCGVAWLFLEGMHGVDCRFDVFRDPNEAAKWLLSNGPLPEISLANSRQSSAA
jgi:hypothetical protein